MRDSPLAMVIGYTELLSRAREAQALTANSTAIAAAGMRVPGLLLVLQAAAAIMARVWRHRTASSHGSAPRESPTDVQDRRRAGRRPPAGRPSRLPSPTHRRRRRVTIVRTRLQRRGDDFLAVARRSIYGWPASPYRRLLAHAGCEYGDLERLVRDDGVEGALATLLQHGVFLTVEEFKGRRPAVRGTDGSGGRARAAVESVRAPAARGALERQPRPPDPGPTDLTFVREHA